MRRIALLLTMGHYARGCPRAGVHGFIAGCAAVRDGFRARSLRSRMCAWWTAPAHLRFENRTIVIENGRITAVTPAAQAKNPSRRARPRSERTYGDSGSRGNVHNHTFYTTRGRSVQLQFSSPRLYLSKRCHDNPHRGGDVAVSRDQHEGGHRAG